MNYEINKPSRNMGLKSLFSARCLYPERLSASKVREGQRKLNGGDFFIGKLPLGKFPWDRSFDEIKNGRRQER
jgi:hypothetical protein